MPKYIIPITYLMYGKYEVEADNIIDALEDVLGDKSVNCKPVPYDSEYVLNSINVDEEDVVENNLNLSLQDEYDLSEYLAERTRNKQ